MIVIADTSPINYLVQIGEVELLEKFYEQVIIPKAVFEELNSDFAPIELKKWISNKPHWLEVKNIKSVLGENLATLDKGEAEAIQTAKELNADLLIIDEKLGRKTAKEFGLKIIGTIGILALAKEKNLINIDEVIRKLEDINFYVSDKLKNYLLENNQ
jgi:predicted nucleic acid-binding protein